jgi:xylitol oxidase
VDEVRAVVAGATRIRVLGTRHPFNGIGDSELQSELLLPRGHAVAASEAVRALAERIRPMLKVAEIRTIAATGSA